MAKPFASTLLKLPITDHRKINLRQKLFFFKEFSPGSCFFEPRGERIQKKLISYMRRQYKLRDYDEVSTPNIYDCDLWKTSGHWDHYKDMMIKFQLGERDFSLKPMNCPGHCLMFKEQELRSSEQLPIRLAEFGVLHRNELSGALLGLTRLRRFQQDDAHIFCTPNQVESEVRKCLEFAQEVYEKFKFTFKVKLSLRPASHLGDSRMWDKAEESLRRALSQANIKWEEQENEGAFYGPKIDLELLDVHQRLQQCATIQLDFQLPERFELVYHDLEAKQLARPVIIHRAIYGSLERFFAMVAENTRGRWPFWLSPLQAQVIPVHEKFNDYASHVSQEFRREGFWVDADVRRSMTLNSKLREAHLMPYNLIMVVGQRDMNDKKVTCRLTSSETTTTRAIGADEKDDDEAAKSEKKVVHNLSLHIERLMRYFREFEEHQIDCANLELLSTCNGVGHNKGSMTNA